MSVSACMRVYGPVKELRSGVESRGRVYRTFNRRIVFVDEMALDQLDCQTRLSDTTATDDNELILAQKLQRENMLANSTMCMCASEELLR
jgi:hypothetical protein